MCRAAWLVLCLGCCLAVQAADEVRTWTHNGKTIQAKFLREVDGEAVFIKDGKLLNVPLDQLSEADRKVISELEKGKTIEEATPPAGVPGGRRKPADEEEAVPFGEPLPPEAAAEANNGAVGNLGKKKLVIENRLWSTVHGERYNGKFVRIRDSEVVINIGSRPRSLAYDTLTAADQEYVNQILVAKGDKPMLRTRYEAPPEPASNSQPIPAAPTFEPPAFDPPSPQLIAPHPNFAPAPSPAQQILEQQQQAGQARAEQAAERNERMAESQQRRIESMRDLLNPPAAESGSGQGSSGLRIQRGLPPMSYTAVGIVLLVALVGICLVVGIAVAIASTSTPRQRRYS